MAGPARKAGVMTSKQPGGGPKSVASKPGPVVPKRAVAPAAPKPAVKAAARVKRMPAAQAVAVAHAAPQARFQRTAAAPAVAPAPKMSPRSMAGMDARISIPKGETITPIAQPSTGNAHDYMSGMALAARGSAARPGYTRPVQPKT